VRLLPPFLLAAAVLPLSCSWFEGTPQPHFVLITVDGLRFDALSRSLGAAKTPNLQALLQDGQGFTHCYSHSPVGFPAHVALFSARTPANTGVTSNGQPIDREVTLLAQWMKDRGYATAGAVSLASLWTPDPEPVVAGVARKPRHELPTGLERGFDVWAVGERELVSAQEVNQRLFGALDGFPKDEPCFLFAQYSEPREPLDAWGSANTSAEVVLDGRVIGTIPTAHARDWIETLELGPGVHELVVRSAVDIVIRRFDARAEGTELSVDVGHASPAEAGKRFVLKLENPAAHPVACTFNAWVHDVPPVAEARARYRLEVEAVDRAIGELVEQLKTRGMYDDTLIVVTADHGTALGEHGEIGSGRSLYDELLRIPLVIKPSRGFDQRAELARLEHRPMRQIDIVPTALELLDLRSLSGAEGLSILQEADRTLHAEVHPPEAASSIFCLRDERYKLIYTSGADRFELYDAVADTLEMDDSFELRGHFRSAWQSELRRAASNSSQSVNARMGMLDQRPAHLRALGY